MLTSKVEDMLNTVVRQIAFYRFETKVHDERRSDASRVILAERSKSRGSQPQPQNWQIRREVQYNTNTVWGRRTGQVRCGT